MPLPRVVLLSVLLPGCASTPDKPPPPAPVPAAAARDRDLDTAKLCQVIAEVEDAEARLKLVDARARLEKAKDKESHFGALLSISNDQDRFHAFHKETQDHPKSALGPLGECFVYAEWKMTDQAQAPCAQADKLLDGAPIVDVARASLKRRGGQLAEAFTLVENARGKDGACAAAHIESARVQEAAGDKAGALGAWQKALAAYPQCASCAVEAAKDMEATQGREASVGAWEKALLLAPDHAEALKRYGAVLAGQDDAKALAAYDKAILGGVNDVTTYMGAAQLARNVDKDKALQYADKALALQANDVDAWRLVLQIASTRNDAAAGDPARAEKAAKEILRLVDEDLAAHLVLARRAKESGDLVTAIVQYDRATRAIAAGRTEPFDQAQLELIKKENAALMKELQVKEPGAKGKAEVVVTSVRKTVQGLFVDRLKKKKGMKGEIDVAVVTVDGGGVDTVEIEKDTLADPAVAASVVGNLRRATIVGAPKRYSFTLEFQ